jgi:hypothetical protein
VRQGVYLCERPREWEEVARLFPRAELAERWRGVVLVTPRGKFFSVPAYEIERWGANGLEAGPLLLFGERTC